MSHWALYVGERGPERVAPLWQLVDDLRGRGLRVAGFVQASLHADGHRVGSEVVRLGGGTGERVALARSGASARGPNEEAFCSMVFDADAFARCRAWLRVDAEQADVIVLDEIGKLEVAGRGHYAAVVDALARPCPVVLSVRGDQLFAALERFALEEPFASRDPSEAIAAFVDGVAAKAHRGP